ICTPTPLWYGTTDKIDKAVQSRSRLCVPDCQRIPFAALKNCNWIAGLTQISSNLSREREHARASGDPKRLVQDRLGAPLQHFGGEPDVGLALVGDVAERARRVAVG